MSYSKLIPLLQKKGSSLTPEQFQERVNIVFHNHEAIHYDQMHTDMKESLQEQIDLLVSDIQKSTTPTKPLKMLDIGCGTGLSSQMLLNSSLGKHVQSVTLLDTSPGMLQKAAEKAKTWNVNYELKNGYLSDVNDTFDVVLICSVLHHIPDLNGFLKQLDAVLNSDGILIHLQDPNSDYLHDAKLLARAKRYADATKNKSKIAKTPASIIPKSVRKWIKKLIGRKDYIDLINDQLLLEKVITKRMTADEIWSVTDIQIEMDKGEENGGISYAFLQEQLVNFQPVSHRSYGFFGLLKSDLSAEFKIEEADCIASNQLNGRNLSAAWIKK